MSNIEFDGVQIDVETVRAKLAEHDAEAANHKPAWPVLVSDGCGAYIAVSSIGGLYLSARGQRATWQYFYSPESAPEAHKYVRDLLDAAVKRECPPAAPEILIDNGQVEYGWSGQQE
jgi:hypothetical protein